MQFRAKTAESSADGRPRAQVMAVPGRADKAQVLCFQEKKPDQPAKLFVMEVGRDAAAGAARPLVEQSTPSHSSSLSLQLNASSASASPASMLRMRLASPHSFWVSSFGDWKAW